MQSYEHAKFIEKCLADYRYDRHFLDKQFKKFLDKKRCSSMYKIIMKYHMPQHVEYLTTLYEHKHHMIIFNTYICNQKTFHNHVYRNILSMKRNYYLFGYLTDFTEIYRLTKDANVSLNILNYFVNLEGKKYRQNLRYDMSSLFSPRLLHDEKQLRNTMIKKMICASDIVNYKKIFNTLCTEQLAEKMFDTSNIKNKSEHYTYDNKRIQKKYHDKINMKNDKFRKNTIMRRRNNRSLIIKKIE